MKKLLFFLTLFCSVQLAQAAEIEFHHDNWTGILQQATAEKKLVFMDAFTTWCGPCKWMAKTAFVDPTVADYFNTHFVNAKIDMEKGEGVELAKKYQVNAYPTLLFVDGNGELVHMAVGARSAEELLQLGKDVIAGNFMSLPAMHKRFAAGERDRAFLKQYIMLLLETSGNFMAPLDIFKEGMKGDALLEKDNWEVFYAVFRRFDTEYAQYFLQHRVQFEEKFGKKPVQDKAVEIYFNGAAPFAQTSDMAGYKKHRAGLSTLGLSNLDSVQCQLDMFFYQSIENWPKYISAVKKHLAALPEADAFFLNDAAWTIYLNSKKKKDLETALSWVNTSVEKESNYANLDTKAMILKSLGRTSEAIETAKKAIEVGKAAGEETTETEKALQEMEAGK